MCRAQKTSGAERETPRWRMDSIRQGTNARHTREKLFLPSRSLRVMAAVAAVMACATAPPCCVSMRLSGSACVGSTSAPAMTALRSSFRGLAVSGSLHTSSSVRASCPGLAAQRTMAPIVAASGYKMKTHKAAAKRFKVTGSGKIVRRQACKAHLLRKKSTSRKKRLTGTTDVFRGDYDNVIGALPYLKVIR